MIPLNKTATFVICAKVNTHKCTAIPASKLYSQCVKRCHSQRHMMCLDCCIYKRTCLLKPRWNILQMSQSIQSLHNPYCKQLACTIWHLSQNIIKSALKCFTIVIQPKVSQTHSLILITFCIHRQYLECLGISWFCFKHELKSKLWLSNDAIRKVITNLSYLGWLNK